MRRSRARHAITGLTLGGPLVLTALLLVTSAAAQQIDWQQLPSMELQAQYAGPLRDTLIQRLRDPVDGTICYVYLPISAPRTVPRESGYVQYGPNAIGTISCLSSDRVRQ